VAEYSDALKESIKSHTEYLVQASPTTSKVRTDDIFTNILMQHGRKPVEDPHVKRKERLRRYGQISGKQINSSHEIIIPTDGKRKKRLRQYGQISGKQIKSSQEIFIPTDGKHPKSVLVAGKAGIGKTLFCQKLIRDWADNKLFRSRANAEVPDFKFAYLLTFRQLNLLGDDPVTLKDILNRSSALDDHSNIDDSIFEYILHHSKEVLIIIDGYDECSQREYIASDSDEKYPNNAKEKMPVAALCAKLIKGKILRGSVVMITSRPDESDEMKAKDIYFDRYVEIIGFSEPQVKEYIGKYFKNNDRMKNIVMDHITKNDNLVSFAHIPVLCFLMCSYFEYTLQQPKKNNPLPVKTSDLYDGVVNMFVRRHDTKKRASLKKTLDELSKLAAQLLLERKFLFFKEDLKTLNLHEVELILCGSGLLHCGPPFRKSFSETTKHFCFTHLTLQEYLAARWFVETRTIPPKHVSTEVVLFMSGILSKQKDNEFEEKMIIHTVLSDDLWEKEAKRGHLISKCLLRYEDIEFAKGIVKRFHDVFDIRNGSFGLSGSRMGDVDCPAVSFTLNVLGALSEEKESEWNTITTLKLTSCTVTDTDVASLCQVLQRPTCKVTELHLGGNQITDAGVASLCQALEKPTCKVIKLYLGFNQIADAGVASLCQALQTPTCKVTELALSGNQITDAGFAILCQALRTPTCKVTELYLDENQITDAGVASLCQGLQTPTCKVTELHLDENQITDAGVASLCQALQTPTCKVTGLYLSENQITDAGVASLCQALQTPTCKVTELYLDDNQITDAGVASLCQALQTPTCKVTKLPLSRNQITDAGVASLCQALQTPTCKITELDLDNNQITDAGVASVCQALPTPTCKVTELHLGGNQITDAGVASLCQALQAPTCKVTELDLGFNQITDAGVASLCQALQAPTCKVTELDLGFNQITDAGVASLCQALQAPTCKVTELDLGFNQITDAGVASLCQALQAPTCKVTKLNMEINQITDAAMDRLKNIL
ncbi:unnamed protein product, partial [Pocillopora meandrina]